MNVSRVFVYLTLGSAIGGWVLGCGSKNDSPSVAGSAAGESCARTADCGSGLACIANVCAAGGASHESGSAQSAGSGQGTGTPSADGGAAVSSARVSQLGESCAATSDCAAELVCVPTRTGTGAGVCDLAAYGLKPTGKVCGGECNTATDCCELPLGISLDLPGGGAVAIHHCEDILQRVLGGNTAICASAPAPSSPTGIGCFYYQTYCAPSCNANTWSCTANTCVYNAACTVNGANQLGGCPSLSRTNTALVANCDTTANRCQIVTTGCNSDAECGDGQPVADVVGATCRGGDCTCHGKGCYLKCSQDLDCQQGYGCDPVTKLCAKDPGCTVSAECVSRLQDVRAECKAGVCQVPCKVDHDCSPSGAVPSLGAFNGTVCVEGRCQTVGCASDSSCTTAVGLRSFCVAPAAAGAGAALRSAITN